MTAQEELLGAWVARLLARLADKDSSTREHTRRVARLTVLVGQELGLRGARLRSLAVAALLHDVGKLQVPDEILGKAGSLTPAEFAVIKRHPADGAELLGHIGGFAGEVPLVRGHHERLDGSGYPDGLRGDELSLELRILGVCDVYDALSSRRVYRRAYDQQQALAILHQGRGQPLRPRRARRALGVVGATARRARLAACEQSPPRTRRPARRARAASRARRESTCPAITLQTASVIGRSTPASRASAASAGAVWSPSDDHADLALRDVRGASRARAARRRRGCANAARCRWRRGRPAPPGPRRCGDRRRAPSRAASSRPGRG